MKKLITILLLASTLGMPSLANATDLWWAVIITTPGTGTNSYAAGWNYKTEDGAIRRVKTECGGSDDCDIMATGKNSCFLITVLKAGKLGAPKFGNWYTYSGEYSSEEEAREEFKKMFNETRHYKERDIQLLKCAGVK